MSVADTPDGSASAAAQTPPDLVFHGLAHREEGAVMDLERLGAFYLGKKYDTGTGRLFDRPVMYDVRDLTTHAVCVGMTGSGKTGLCIDLLEEAAKSRKGEVLVSLGESLLGVFMGRRSTRAASTTLGKYRQRKTAAMSIGETEQALEAVRREAAAIEEELREKAEEVRVRWDEAEERLEKVPAGGSSPCGTVRDL